MWKYTFSGLVAEKADEVLFFVDKQTENESPG